MIDLRNLEKQLSSLEIEIYGWIAEHADRQPASHDSISALMAVKSAVDRIRPLLWIQLRRLGVKEEADPDQPPSDIAKMMSAAGLDPIEVPKRFMREPSSSR